MYQQILVPTDGSPGADAAIAHAIDHAKKYDAALHAIYAVHVEVGGEATIGSVYEVLEQTGKSALDDVISQAEAAGVETVDATVVQGTPHRSILQYAADNDIDLIVMGTHGRTGFERYLLGSVTEKVVRLSDVPVLTVRMPSE